MSVAYIPASTAEVLEHVALDSNGALLTGLTDLLVHVRRVSDGFFYDWADSTFKSSGWTTRNQTLTAVDATNDPGRYSVSWPGAATGEYAATITQTGSTCKNVPAWIDLRVGALPTAAAVASIQADTDDIQARLPAALVGGRIDASVGAVAANAITSSAIATDAIGSAQLAASAVTEIQAGLATSTAQTTAQTSLTDIQGRLPAALVSGRIDASVGAMAANVVTAAAIATDAIDNDAIAASAVTEIQAGLATSTALATAQTAITDIQGRLPAALVSGRIDASVGAVASGAITSTAIATDAIGAAQLAADAVAEIQSGLATSSAVAALPTTVQALILSDATPFAGANINATISSRSSHSAADVWLSGTRTLTGIGSSGIASAAGVTAVPSALLDALLAGHNGVGSVGESLSLIASRSSISADDVWAATSRTLTGIGSSGIASQSSVNALPSASTTAAAVWNEALSGHTTAGSAGAALALVDVAVSSRATNAGVWSTAEGTPSAGTYGYALRVSRMAVTNRQQASAGNPGTLVTYADDGTTPFLTQELRDSSGGAVTDVAGSPARRSAAA